MKVPPLPAPPVRMRTLEVELCRGDVALLQHGDRRRQLSVVRQVLGILSPAGGEYLTALRKEWNQLIASVGVIVDGGRKK